MGFVDLSHEPLPYQLSRGWRPGDGIEVAEGVRWFSGPEYIAPAVVS